MADLQFREYLVAHGYDVSQMGVHDEDSTYESSVGELKQTMTDNEKSV